MPWDHDAQSIEGIARMRSDLWAPSDLAPEEPDDAWNFISRPIIDTDELKVIAATKRVFEEKPVLPSLRPSGILDERNAVVEWLVNPSNSHSLGAFIGGGKVPMTPSCLNYWMPGADEKYLAALVKNAVADEVFYVTDDMARMADAGSRSLPDRIEINEATLPSPHGVIRLEQPRYTLDQRGRRLGNTVFAWRVVHAQNGRFLMLMHFTHRDDHVDEINAFLEKDTPGKMHLLAPWQLAHFEVVPFGKQINLDGKHDVSDTPFILALFLLLGQKIASSTKANIDRPASRRAMRLKLGGSVTVIDLRKIQYVGEETDEHHPVNWSCRWFVRMHWRHLDRPEDPASIWCELHQRRCRLTPIFPYAKNAERTDLPWRDPSRRLHRLAR